MLHVLFSEDAEEDAETGLPAFLASKRKGKATGKNPAQVRRERNRKILIRQGYPLHMIEQRLDEAEAETLRLYHEAGILTNGGRKWQRPEKTSNASG